MSETTKRGGAKGLGIPFSVKTFPRRRQDERGEERHTPLQTLLLGSLNVRGCSTSDVKRREIGEMFLRRKLDVLALSETKLKGKGECEFGAVSGRKSGVEEGRAREGVVLILSDRLASSVTEWKEVSPRLMWVKVKLGVERWAFVSAYGPGSERSEEEREQFWTDLSECIESFGGHFNVVVLGDLNARVGDEMVENVIGRYGVPGRNDSGENLIGLCMEQELVVGNSLFKKRDIHKYTWVRMAHGAMVERALMDFVLISRRVVKRLLDVRVLRGEGGGVSDHLLVEGRLRVEQEWKGATN